MMAHTRGPWEYDETFRQIVGPDSIAIADMTRWVSQFPELTANARLIAAAPDLLDIAIRAVESERDMCPRQKWYPDAVAAIAKARGETP